MTAVANPLRGECALAVNGLNYVLRPSFENLVLAEAELGSLFALVERAAGGALTLTEMTALLWHCLPIETRPERVAVGQAVLAMGMVSATGPVRAVLAQVLKGEA
ncbi:MAG: gene transfer agent family protein [Sphingomonadales bacterium]|nr:gene transfer agent family protein [Sphingomonadales bacterium]NCQ21237.1 gene transfer agent family protein [Sphingomonadales bacterium]NCT04010.1 gene transfer agent family protein [Sphingomonadales bacterium]